VLVTSGEACTLLVDLTRELAQVRAERDVAVAAYRAVAVAGLHHAHSQHVENARLRAQLAALRDELRRYTATALAGRRAA
jgi:hypothetical protein